MREIIFRGKRKDCDAWEIGNYIKYLSLDGSCRYYINGFEYEVFHETVGQYTGLKDKNGQRIFEGDIVKRCFTLRRGATKTTRETQVGVVAYKDDECGFCLKNTCNLRRPWDGDTIEIIGNIHDNQEVLKEGEEIE